MNKKVKEALEVVEDEDIDMTFLERFDALGQELIANSFKAIKRIQRLGLKSPDGENERYIQEQSMYQFRQIDRVLTTLTRANRIKSEPNKNFDAQLMKKIKEEKSSIGSIVRDLNPIKTSNGGQ